MPLPRRRRVAAGLLAALVVDAGLAALAGAPAGAVRPVVGQESAASQQKGRSVATLEIIAPGASIRRAGKEAFKPAKDGQKLRVGDTIQTDATGFVEIVYADDSFTRLDVNTTFTIESLTDDEGNRKIKGSVESGQTWNRVEALTENESFEQEGAGATAAVTGTAFAYQCTPGVPVSCILTTVVNGVTYTSVDGELQVLDPLMQCDATEVDDTNSDLCDVPTELSEAALLANSWLMTNLFLDGLLGYEGPVFGVIVVEDGVVTSVTPIVPPVAGGTEQPTIPDPAVNITFSEGGYQETPGTYDEIITDENSAVEFNLLTGGAMWIVFTDLFDDDPNVLALNGEPPFGALLYQDGESWLPVEALVQYLSTTNFMFEPSEVTPPLEVNSVGAASNHEYFETGEFTFYVETADGVQSNPETVTVTVYDVPCDCYEYYEYYGGESSTESAPAPAPESTEDPPAAE